MKEVKFLSEKVIHTITIECTETTYDASICKTSRAKLFIDGNEIKNIKRFAIDWDFQSGDINQPYMIEKYLE